MISNKKGDHNYIILLFLLFVFIISFIFTSCFLFNEPNDKIDVGEEDPFLNQSNTSNNNEDFKSETRQDGGEEEIAEEETTEENEQTGLENEEEVEENKETESLTIKVYYADSMVQYLVGEERIISSTYKYISAFMELLKPPLEPGHFMLIPENTKVNRISFDNGNITLDLSSEFVEERFKGDAVDVLLVYSVVNTFTEFSEINTVTFYVNGQRLNTLGQLDISDPLYRDESWIKES